MAYNPFTNPFARFMPQTTSAMQPGLKPHKRHAVA